MKQRFFAGAAAIALLAGCQAEEVQVKLSAEDIMRAANGQTVYVDFNAEVGETYTTVDEEKRDTIAKVMRLMERYFPDSDVDSDIGSDEYTIELDGELRMSTEAPLKDAPWYVAVEYDRVMNGYLVSLQPSDSFDAFNGAMEGINFMLGPDEYQPVKYRITGDKGMIVFGGGYLDGRAVTAGAVPLTGERLNLSFNEGVWTSTGAGFYYIPE